jgi:hypothetical protein
MPGRHPHSGDKVVSADMCSEFLEMINTTGTDELVTCQYDADVDPREIDWSIQPWLDELRNTVAILQGQ